VEVGSFHFLVSDIFFGGDLFDRIVERGSYSEDEVRAVVRQLLSILSYLHGPEAQIVHRVSLSSEQRSFFFIH
jgi:serine/threonine protein kinase